MLPDPRTPERCILEQLLRNLSDRGKIRSWDSLRAGNAIERKRSVRKYSKLQRPGSQLKSVGKSYCVSLDDGADHTGAEIALLTAGNKGR